MDIAKKRKQKTVSIYTSALITRRVVLRIHNIGNNLRQTLEKIVSSEIEGKCITEGFVKPLSTKIQSYSSGCVQGINVSYEVILECKVCAPVEGQHIAKIIN